VDVKFSQKKHFCSYCHIMLDSKIILMDHILEVHGKESRQSSLEFKNEPGTSIIKTEPLDVDFGTSPDSFREFVFLFNCFFLRTEHALNSRVNLIQVVPEVS